MSSPVDAQLFSNISATTAAFTLKGGIYLMTAIGTFTSGSVELQVLGPDGSTWISLPTAAKLTATATSILSGYLPPGEYRLTLTSATGVSVSVAGCPIS